MYRMRRLLGEEIGVFLNPKIKSFLTGTKRISVQLVMNMLYTSKKMCALMYIHKKDVI